MTAEALVCRQFLGLSPSHPACDEAGDFLLGELPGGDTELLLLVLRHAGHVSDSGGAVEAVERSVAKHAGRQRNGPKARWPAVGIPIRFGGPVAGVPSVPPWGPCAWKSTTAISPSISRRHRGGGNLSSVRPWPFADGPRAACRKASLTSRGLPVELSGSGRRPDGRWTGATQPRMSSRRGCRYPHPPRVLTMLAFFAGPMELLILGVIVLLMFGNRIPSVMRRWDRA